MEDEISSPAGNLTAIAQQLGELAAHLRELAQQPLVTAAEQQWGETGIPGVTEPDAVVVSTSSS